MPISIHCILSWGRCLVQKLVTSNCGFNQSELPTARRPAFNCGSLVCGRTEPNATAPHLVYPAVSSPAMNRLNGTWHYQVCAAVQFEGIDQFYTILWARAGSYRGLLAQCMLCFQPPLYQSMLLLSLLLMCAFFVKTSESSSIDCMGKGEKTTDGKKGGMGRGERGPSTQIDRAYRQGGGDSALPHKARGSAKRKK